jgi:hypothetical protein
VRAGGVNGRALAAHRARVRRSVAAGPRVDFALAGALTCALQTFCGGAATLPDASQRRAAAPLAREAAAREADQRCLLVTVAALGAAASPRFAAAAAATALPPAADDAALLAAALALPELAPGLLPAYAALPEHEQAAVRAAVDAAQRCEGVCSGEAPAGRLAGVRRAPLACALAARACLRAGAPCGHRDVQPHGAIAAADAAAAAAALAAAFPSRPPLQADGDDDADADARRPPRESTAAAAVAAADAPSLAFALLRAGASRAHPLFELQTLAPLCFDGGGSARTAAGAASAFRAREGLACLRVLALAGWTHAAPATLLERLRQSGGPLLDELAPRPPGALRAPPPPLALRGLGSAVRAALAPPRRASAAALALPATHASEAATEADADAAAAEVLAALQALCSAARAAFTAAPHTTPRGGAATLEVDASPLGAAMRGGGGAAGGGGAPRAARAARLRALCAACRVTRTGDASGTVMLPAPKAPPA